MYTVEVGYVQNYVYTQMYVYICVYICICIIYKMAGMNIVEEMGESAIVTSTVFGNGGG